MPRKDSAFQWTTVFVVPEGCEPAIRVAHNKGVSEVIFLDPEKAKAYYLYLRQQRTDYVTVNRCAVMRFPDGAYRMVKLNKISFGDNNDKLIPVSRVRTNLRSGVRSQSARHTRDTPSSADVEEAPH